MTTSPVWLVSRSLVAVTLCITSLLAAHVQAENSTNSTAESTTFRERLQQGPTALSHWDILLFGGITYVGFELMSYAALHTGEWFHAKRVPVRGKHLDVFSTLDQIFIHFNKMSAFPFLYVFVRYAYFAAPRVAWQLSEFTFTNTILAIPLLYIVYDFFYTILHGVLHIKGIYGLIHKHHHQQKAPSRGNTDAINVHPVEFLLGEFNHLWALHVVCTYLGVQVHIVSALFFLVAGGYMAGLNHTRHDLVVLGGIIYDSKAHDVHHRIPQSNYGQYTMFWDHIIGSYRAYNPSDRINPKAQLNLKTGKSLMYHEAAAAKAE